MDTHGLHDKVIVADVGMVSDANTDAIETGFLQVERSFRLAGADLCATRGLLVVSEEAGALVPGEMFRLVSAAHTRRNRDAGGLFPVKHGTGVDPTRARAPLGIRHPDQG